MWVFRLMDQLRSQLTPASTGRHGVIVPPDVTEQGQTSRHAPSVFQTHSNKRHGSHHCGF